jgi:hypothetical protein
LVDIVVNGVEKGVTGKDIPPEENERMRQEAMFYLKTAIK